ncbi:MAG: hypothetical protein P8L47_02770 [Candidatus Marinamargulisbacteria bacterium]|nr:hypothetical protein [Candidatus Marinamargulisbacteria bacterium]
MGVHSLFLTNRYTVRQCFVWGLVVMGLIILSPEGYAKNSKSLGIRLGVNKGSIDSVSVSTETQSSDTPVSRPVSKPKVSPKPEPKPTPVPQAQATPAPQQANTNQSRQQQYTTLSIQVQQLVAQLNQQQLQINQQQLQINQLTIPKHSAETQPIEPAKVYTCYINETRNTYIGEGATQVVAKAKTLSQCKADNGWCKPDTLVCD